MITLLRAYVRHKYMEELYLIHEAEGYSVCNNLFTGILSGLQVEHLNKGGKDTMFCREIFC